MSPNEAKQFCGWMAESRLADSLRSVYGRNPEQLKELWAALPADLQADPDVRATAALCFLRLADAESAKSIAPDVFCVDEAKLLGSTLTHRLSRMLLRLYLKRWKILYLPIAWVVSLWFRRFSDAQLLLNMYFKVWANNTLGLKYIFPLFARSILRPDSADRHRNICFFGYIAGTSCRP